MYGLVIADDERELLEGLSQFFPWESIGFTVVGTFGDGRSALSFCRKHEVDVVLTDIRMPFMGGLELIKEIRLLPRQPLFCVMSAYSEFEYAKQAIQLGVQDYLVKPAGFDEIKATFEKIRTVLDGTTIPAPAMAVSESENPLVAQTFAIVEKRLSSCTLQNIAGELDVNASYLSRLFKEETGKKFQEYLLSRKMEAAKQMLSSKVEYKNREIAHALGYQDTQNFCRCFRNYWGKSPQKFRLEMDE
jgi:two-component system, response regulator YesN